MPDTITSHDTTIHLLRHFLAVIAYRGGKVMRDAPAGFGYTRASADTNSAVHTLSHINDVLAWGASITRGQQAWNEVEPGDWHTQIDRFHDVLREFDAALKAAASSTLPCEAERLLAGPLADSLWHIGQLATLRRIAGAPVKGENYFVAEIEAGRVGRDQARVVKEVE